MCLQYIKLKTKNPNASQYGYVPCGICSECRKRSQNDWKFRLNSEFLTLKNKGWNVAFCTLTYENNNLPTIPKVLFKNEEEYKKIACFSKEDVTNWIHGVRQYFKYHNNFTNGNNIRYFIASEYGSNTHRPHYHAILAWKNDVSYETMHKICTEKWNHGFLFPRNVNGDKDMLPFKIVGDASKALNYVSKYACKDIDFDDTIKKLNLNKNMKLYKNIQSFHLQSKSLGFEIIKNMSDDEKHKVFVNGISFQGDGETYKIPIYIKNKIVFDNYYVIKKNGQRLVRRKASEFFNKYKYELFKEKAKFYEKLFNETLNYDYFTKRGVDEQKAKSFSDSIAYYKDCVNHSFGFDVFGCGVFSHYYMCYFGVKYTSCKTINNFNDAVKQWMRRYQDPNKVEVIKSEDLLNHECWQAIQNVCSMILGCNTYCNLNVQLENENKDRLNKKILDYYNNVLKQRIV